MDEKRLRFDLVIALCALLISGVAAAASAYQTYVIRQQYSATVWPYLTFISTSSATFFWLRVNNAGIGPALIRSAVVSRDGKPIVVAGEPVDESGALLRHRPRTECGRRRRAQVARTRKRVGHRQFDRARRRRSGRFNARSIARRRPVLNAPRLRRHAAHRYSDLLLFALGHVLDQAAMGSGGRASCRRGLSRNVTSAAEVCDR